MYKIYRKNICKETILISYYIKQEIKSTQTTLKQNKTRKQIKQKRQNKYKKKMKWSSCMHFTFKFCYGIAENSDTV